MARSCAATFSDVFFSCIDSSGAACSCLYIAISDGISRSMSWSISLAGVCADRDVAKRSTAAADFMTPHYGPGRARAGRAPFAVLLQRQLGPHDVHLVEAAEEKLRADVRVVGDGKQITLARRRVPAEGERPGQLIAGRQVPHVRGDQVLAAEREPRDRIPVEAAAVAAHRFAGHACVAQEGMADRSVRAGA